MFVGFDLQLVEGEGELESDDGIDREGSLDVMEPVAGARSALLDECLDAEQLTEALAVHLSGGEADVVEQATVSVPLTHVRSVPTVQGLLLVTPAHHPVHNCRSTPAIRKN